MQNLDGYQYYSFPKITNILKVGQGEEFRNQSRVEKLVKKETKFIFVKKVLIEKFSSHK